MFRASYLFLACSCFSWLLADDIRRKVDFWPGGGVFVQVVDSSEWKTSFYFRNMDDKVVYVGMGFLDDSGQDLSLPFQGISRRVALFSLQPNTTMVLETDGVGALKQGSALVMTCDRPCADANADPVDSKLAGIAVFRQRVAGRQDSEAVVPMELPDTQGSVMFNNRQGYETGVAVMNASSSTDTVSVTLRDDSGAVIAQDSIPLGPMQKMVFALTARYPATAGKFGSIDFQGSAVLPLGLWFNPGGSFTSAHNLVPIKLQ